VENRGERGGPHAAEETREKRLYNSGHLHQLPTMSIHVIVIGAGLAGLSAAISTKVANHIHQVTMLESVKELAEIGVSISSPL
jgi:NADPH-dependent 2,4-dienoyl-CoA reductase/sulfur reductase-like enzyme